MSSRPRVKFPSTAWSTIRTAQDQDSPECLAAMNRCIAGYWRPVFCFLRAKGYRLHRAEDLTQEFFLKFFQRDWISRADPRRGRFRTFLLTILTRFLCDQGPRRGRRQKLFDDRLVSVSALIGDREQEFEPPDDQTPEEIFMRQWARAVIRNVRRRLEAWCDSEGRPEWYKVFSAVHFPRPDAARSTQETLAERLRLTRDQVRYGLEQANRQFRAFLQAEVAEQVGSAAEVDTEIKELTELLAK